MSSLYAAICAVVYLYVLNEDAFVQLAKGNKHTVNECVLCPDEEIKIIK